MVGVCTYIKVVLLKRRNLKIGRIELAIDYQLVNKLIDTKQTIKINNKNQDLEFKYDRNLKGYIIKNSIKGAGNYIYIKPIKDLIEDKKHLTKYLFKYLLKSSQDMSFDSQVFSHLKFKQKQYSHNFFTKKVKKHQLEKLSSIVYNLKKYKKNEYLDNIPNEAIMYHLAYLFNEDILKYEDEKLILTSTNTIIYSPIKFDVIEVKKDRDYWTKKRQILELKKDINTILTDKEEVVLYNLDVFEQREKEYVKKYLMNEDLHEERKSSLEDTQKNIQKSEYKFRQDIQKNTFDLGFYQTNLENFKWEKESQSKREKREKMILYKSQQKRIETILEEHYYQYLEKHNLTEEDMSKGYNSSNYKFLEIYEF